MLIQLEVKLYLWDTNIVRQFESGHENLRLHLQNTSWDQIALPSTVIAEILQGRIDFALKATPEQAPFAHRLLVESQKFLRQFNIIIFDEASATAMLRLQKKVNSRKRYADVMIAATAIAHRHTVVTRNMKHFTDLLPKSQLTNWIDTLP